MTGSWDAETGVLVVGAGACGLAAAIAAHDAGADVAVVEKLERGGGNTVLSSGSVAAGGSRFQREAGIEDSADLLYDDLMRKSGPHEAEAVTRLLADGSASLVEWLVDRAGARLALVTRYRHVGHSVPRLHAPRSRRGKDLFDDLERAVVARGIPLAFGQGASALVAGDDGSVQGAVLRDLQGNESRIRAGKVILATNGYAANADLVREFCPEMAGAAYYGAPGSTGDGIVWGRELGAELANIGAYQGHAAVVEPHGAPLTWTVIEKGGVLVGRDGRRFANEDLGYSGFARAVIAQGEFAWAVFDGRITDIARDEDKFLELMQLGAVRVGETLAEIAAPHGIDADGLADTLEVYNGAARGEWVDEFGRQDFALAPLAGPWGIIRVTAGLFHTQGGLRIDGGARVLRPGRSPIPNLFAGGGAAGGVCGQSGGAGYSSGAGLLAALGLGRIAGETAAREIAEGR